MESGVLKYFLGDLDTLRTPHTCKGKGVRRVSKSPKKYFRIPLFINFGHTLRVLMEVMLFQMSNSRKSQSSAPANVGRGVPAAASPAPARPVVAISPVVRRHAATSPMNRAAGHPSSSSPSSSSGSSSSSSASASSSSRASSSSSSSSSRASRQDHSAAIKQRRKRNRFPDESDEDVDVVGEGGSQPADTIDIRHLGQPQSDAALAEAIQHEAFAEDEEAGTKNVEEGAENEPEPEANPETPPKKKLKSAKPSMQEVQRAAEKELVEHQKARFSLSFNLLN